MRGNNEGVQLVKSLRSLERYKQHPKGLLYTVQVFMLLIVNRFRLKKRCISSKISGQYTQDRTYIKDVKNKDQVSGCPLQAAEVVDALGGDSEVMCWQTPFFLSAWQSVLLPHENCHILPTALNAKINARVSFTQAMNYSQVIYVTFCDFPHVYMRYNCMSYACICRFTQPFFSSNET